MLDQHKYRPQQLALAIALAMGCPEFSNAQEQATVAEPPPVVEVAEQPDTGLASNPLAKVNPVKGERTKVRADGGGSVIYLDSSKGSEPGETDNLKGLYHSEDGWTLTSNGEIKESMAVRNNSILTNNGKIQGGANTFGRLFNKGEIKGHVQVEAGGTFLGAGNVGSLGVHGQVNVNRLHGAPNVKGDLNLFETAVLAYEVNPDGRGETIKVGGTASLGGATLKIDSVPGDYPISSQYTLIKAKKVEGRFSRVLHDLAFMKPNVKYEEKTVELTYARNDVPFEDLAASDNARAFGANITEPQNIPEAPIDSDSRETKTAQLTNAGNAAMVPEPRVPADTHATAPLPLAAEIPVTPPQPLAAEAPETAARSSTTPSTPVTPPKPAATAVTAAKTTTATNAAIAALLASNKATAALALEQLAGSSNANLAKATLSSVDPVSGSMLSAMRQLDSANGSSHLRDAPYQAAGSADHGRAWVQALGHGGKLDRDVEPLQHSTKGLLIGADWSLDEEWRLGVMGGKSRTRLDSRELEGGLDSWHLGAYALRRSGPMSIRFAATYSNHNGNTARRVAFPGFSDRPEGRYDASTQQAFAEIGYNLGQAAISIEPFASLGVQRYQRDGYTEKGGAAALKVNEQAKTNMNSTLGLRMAKVDTLSNGMRLTPRFSAGWKHTYGNVSTNTSQRLVTGGRDYTVYGAELDRNSLQVDAGLDLGVSTHHSIGVALTSEIGTDSRNHGVTGQWRMSF